MKTNPLTRKNQIAEAWCLYCLGRRMRADELRLGDLVAVVDHDECESCNCTGNRRTCAECQDRYEATMENTDWSDV